MSGDAEDDEAAAGALDLAAEVALDLLGRDLFQARMDHGVTGRQRGFARGRDMGCSLPWSRAARRRRTSPLTATHVRHSPAGRTCTIRRPRYTNQFRPEQMRRLADTTTRRLRRLCPETAAWLSR